MLSHNKYFNELTTDVLKLKQGSLKPEIPDEYKIFTPLQRRCIFAVVSLTGIISPLSSLIYTPALSTVATYLGVSIADVNLTITTYLILQGITPSIWGTLSDHYGRRLLYIVTLLIYVGACIGLSVTKSYGVVLALRALQAAGSSSTLALGSGVIRDLFAPSERGGYFGFYTAGIAVGTAFGPTLGGILAQYTGFHGLFLFLLGLSGTALLLIICLLPETHHSRIHGRHNPVPRIRRPIFTGLEPSADHVVSAKQSAKPPFNPFGPLKLLLQYDVLCCVSFTGICYTVWQNSMVATATIYADRYHLSQVQVGLTYISNGVGSVVGNLVVGKLLDYHYKQQLARENPDRETQRKDLLFIEHARLRSLKYAAPGFVGSVIALGWIMNSTVHISASIVFAFFLGWTDSSILTTYCELINIIY